MRTQVQFAQIHSLLFRGLGWSFLTFLDKKTVLKMAVVCITPKDRKVLDGVNNISPIYDLFWPLGQKISSHVVNNVHVCQLEQDVRC